MDLPPHLTQSLFFKSAEYLIALRYSTGQEDLGTDERVPQLCGLGIKVFNVQGEMFDSGKDFPMQDIEFNSTTALDLPDANH